MASNTQTYNQIFQAAESAISVGMENTTVLSNALDAGVSPPADSIASTTVDFSGSNINSTVEVELVSDQPIPCPGYSATGSNLECIYFKAVGYGSLSGTNISAVNEQGFYRKVPALNSVTN